MKYNPQKLSAFKRRVKGYYRSNKRILPWRDVITPYRILISEVMLQQTQVGRVLQKYPAFIARFPDFPALAAASTAQILREWQGMGYNRRGLYLKRIAETVTGDYGDVLPRTIPELDNLPGIGEATAASIAVYAYNIPAVFIETNIRRVYIHHFFKDRADIDDKEIVPLVEKTLDRENPREWYYALMDYGTYLGKTVTNPNRRSKHYTVQAGFEGSDRQLRGKIIRLLLKGKISGEELYRQLIADKERLGKILHDMENEGLIEVQDSMYSIT